MIILTFRNMKKDIETLLDQALTGQLLERPQVEELRCSFHSIGGAAALPAILHADRHKKAAWRGCGFACDPPCQPSQEGSIGKAAALPTILHADHFFRYSNRSNCVCGLLITISSIMICNI